MNINDLTIGQAKELAALFGETQSNQAQKQNHAMIGKYVIARCYAAGVHAGEVVSVDGENIILKNSRRLWNWKAKDGIALSGLAQRGPEDGGCKIDVINPEIYLTGVCELIPVASGVKDAIHGYK
jgi:hypothetical protein